MLRAQDPRTGDEIPNLGNDEEYWTSGEQHVQLKNQDKLSGFCQVELVYLPDPAEDELPEVELAEPTAEELAREQDEVRDDLSMAAAAALKLMRLEVTIFEANGLPRMDIVGKNDPYAQVTAGPGGEEAGHIKRTRTVEGGGKNPKWTHGSVARKEPGEMMSFDLHDLPSEKLTIKLFDEHVGSADELIGECEVPLELMPRDKDWVMDDWYTVMAENVRSSCLLIPHVLAAVLVFRALCRFESGLDPQGEKQAGTLSCRLRWIVDPEPAEIDEEEFGAGDLSAIEGGTPTQPTGIEGADGADRPRAEGSEDEALVEVAEEEPAEPPPDWVSILGDSRQITSRSGGRRTPIVHREILPDEQSQADHPDVVALATARAASIMVAGSQLHSMDVSSVHTADFQQSWVGADKMGRALESSQRRTRARKRWHMLRLFGRGRANEIEISRTRKELSVAEIIEEHTAAHRAGVKPHQFTPAKHDGFALCGGCAVLLSRMLGFFGILSGIWLWLATLCAGAGLSMQCWAAHNQGGDGVERPEWDSYRDGFTEPITDVLLFTLLAQLLAALSTKFQRLLYPALGMCLTCCSFVSIKATVLYAQVKLAEQDENASAAAATAVSEMTTSSGSGSGSGSSAINDTEPLQAVTAEPIADSSWSASQGPSVSGTHWALLISAAVLALVQFCLLGCFHLSSVAHAKRAKKQIYKQGFTHAQQQIAFAELEQSNLVQKPYQFAKFRLWFKIVATHAGFEWYIASVVLVECAILAAWTPRMDKQRAAVVEGLHNACVGIFVSNRSIVCLLRFDLHPC